MSIDNQLRRSAALELIEETINTIKHYEDELQNSFLQQEDLKGRKSLLEQALTKTQSGMAQSIMKNMINELQSEIENHENHAILSENNRNYYLEILKALKEVYGE